MNPDDANVALARLDRVISLTVLALDKVDNDLAELKALRADLDAILSGLKTARPNGTGNG